MEDFKLMCDICPIADKCEQHMFICVPGYEELCPILRKQNMTYTEETELLKVTSEGLRSVDTKYEGVILVPDANPFGWKVFTKGEMRYSKPYMISKGPKAGQVCVDIVPKPGKSRISVKLAQLVFELQRGIVLPHGAYSARIKDVNGKYEADNIEVVLVSTGRVLDI